MWKLLFLSEVSLQWRIFLLSGGSLQWMSALGITTLFPNLKDPDSKTAYVSIDKIHPRLHYFVKALFMMLSFPIVNRGHHIMKLMQVSHSGSYRMSLRQMASRSHLDCNPLIPPDTAPLCSGFTLHSFKPHQEHFRRGTFCLPSFVLRGFHQK